MVAQCKAITEQTHNQITGIILVADKGYGGAKRLERETGIAPIVLALFDLRNELSDVAELYLPDGEYLLKNFRQSPREYFDNANQRLIRNR